MKMTRIAQSILVVRASGRKLQQCGRRLRESVALGKRGHWIIATPPEPPLILGVCACCLAKATVSRRERDSHGNTSVIVPYCDACLRHAVRPRVMRLGTMYASTLLAIFGGTLLATLWPSWWQTSAVATIVAALPVAWSNWLSLPRQLGHAARGQAVVIVPNGLAFASESYVRLVQPGASEAPKPARLRPRRLGALELVGPVLAIVLTPCLNYLFFPVVRVLNFTDRSLVVSVDERRLGRIEPTSAENPAAGVLLRAPSGRHRITAVDDEGQVASDAVVQIRSGFSHLYAPGANSSCFYLQRVSHGRSQFDGESLVPLSSDDRFWAIPNSVDFWFAPESTLRSAATTGGVVTHLRMGRCR